jgi:outer membrane murein-binding lipoprotein Lpp
MRRTTVTVAAIALAGGPLSGCASSKPAAAPTVTFTQTTTVSASVAEQTQLEQQRAALDQRQRDLDARESKVNQAEQIAKKSTMSHDGVYLVGQEIEPGTWRTSGHSGCYWERLRGLSRELDDIVANENTDGPAVVTIATSDVAFKTHDCGEWARIG